MLGPKLSQLYSIRRDARREVHDAMSSPPDARHDANGAISGRGESNKTEGISSPPDVWLDAQGATSEIGKSSNAEHIAVPS